MIITVNGEKQVLEGSEITIGGLLLRQKVSKPEMVSVQVNGQFVDKKDFGVKKIVTDDEVDFLYFLGGGKRS